MTKDLIPTKITAVQLFSENGLGLIKSNRKLINLNQTLKLPREEKKLQLSPGKLQAQRFL